MDSSPRGAWRGLLAACLAVHLAVTAAQVPNPLIGPHDQLKITVFGVDELSRAYMVDNDGVLEFPWINAKIKVSDMTIRQLESELAGRLKAGGFLVSPQVAIELTQAQNKKVMISGSVRTQGPVTFGGEMRVLEALTRAGGVLPEASDHALVIRGVEQLPVNIRDVLQNGNLSGNITLQDGDVLVVTKAQQVFIYGYVRTPGGYSVETGVNLRQALALAGGISEKGSDRGIKILRPVPGKERPDEVKDVKMETAVRPGDTIIVKARIF